MKLMLIGLSLLVSGAAFAAPAVVYTAVLTNAEVAKYLTSEVKKIEETGRYRCPQCYDITVTAVSR